jgi:multiple sugar transport system substrate-binding protein
MKRFWMMSLMVLVVLTIAMPAVAQDGPVTVTISTWAGVDESAELQEILDDINDGNDVFQVIHQPMPADYMTQVQTQMAGGVGADMYWLSQENMSLASQGVLLELSDCLADAEEGTVADVNDYYPDVFKANLYEDGVYGLPWIAQPVVVYYNTDLFDAAMLDYPEEGWTWDDFVETAKALTLDTDGDGEIDQWGFTQIDGWPPPFMWIWQAGGELINEDFTEAPIDSPEFLEGMEFFLSLTYNGEFTPSQEYIAEQGFNEPFKAGKIAMFMGGAADDLDRIEGLPVNVIHVPAHPETGSKATFAWNASTVIWSGTENPEVACQALLAVTDGIHHWKVFSPRISQGTVEHLVASVPEKAHTAEAIISAAEEMRALPIFGNYAEFNTLFWRDFRNPLVFGETDLTLEEMATEMRPEFEDTLP